VFGPKNVERRQLPSEKLHSIVDAIKSRYFRFITQNTVTEGLLYTPYSACRRSVS